MTIRIVLLMTLFLASLGWGADYKDYEACKDLKEEAQQTICMSVEFSKQRLIQNSDADQYAQRADGYRAPSAEGDGRSGGTFLSCDKQRNDCAVGCKDDAGCRDGCLRSYTQCAGMASSSSPGFAPAERPDGYTVEFNDEITKNQ